MRVGKKVIARVVRKNAATDYFCFLLLGLNMYNLVFQKIHTAVNRNFICRKVICHPESLTDFRLSTRVTLTIETCEASMRTDARSFFYIQVLYKIYLIEYT